jgi:hypothetical protein
MVKVAVIKTRIAKGKKGLFAPGLLLMRYSSVLVEVIIYESIEKMLMLCQVRIPRSSERGHHTFLHPTHP